MTAGDGLREADFAAGPIEQFGRWYEEARAAIGDGADAIVVATAGADCVPTARVVLLRGVSERGFVFFTNYESAKGRDLAVNARAAIVAHWRELDRQVRVTGRVTRRRARRGRSPTGTAGRATAG